MTGIVRAIAVAALPLLLTGCYSLAGVPQMINAGGVVNEAGTGTERTQNLKANFRIAVEAAATRRQDWGAVSQMLDTGYLLAYSNCDDFFRVMGTRQRDSNISRDLVAPVVSILSGIISLKNFTNAGRQQDYIEGIGLGSSVYVSTLDIHDRHFLFGAENIYEVETLTLDALDASEGVIRGLGTMNFESAVQRLIRHQGVCTPESIKGLAKRAIAVGDVVANGRIGEGLPNQDRQILWSVGQQLGLPGAASEEQAAAVWWLLSGAAVPAEYATIKQVLVGTNAAARIDPAGTYDSSGAPDEKTLNDQLAALSPETLARYVAARDQYRSALADYSAKMIGLAAGATPPVSPQFAVAAQGSNRSYRLEVK